MNKKEFEELYNKYQLKDLVKILDCSVPTIYSRINEFQIDKKGRGKGKRQRKKIIIDD